MLQFARLPPTFPFSTKHSHFAVDQQLTSYNLMRKCRVWACRPDSRLRYSVEIQTGCLIDNYIYNQELNVHGLEFGTKAVGRCRSSDWGGSPSRIRLFFR